MSLKTTYQQIKAIIPEVEFQQLLGFVGQSILFGILDLISIAYLIPAVLLLLDKNKLLLYFERNHIDTTYLDSNNLIIGVFVLVFLFVVKNLMQTRFNVRLYDFLYGLSHRLSMAVLERYLGGDYLNFQQQNKGTVIQHVTRVANDFSCSLIASMVYLISESFTFLVILLALLVLYFKLTIMALVALGAFAFWIYRIKKQQMKLIDETFKSEYAKSNAELLNILDGFIEIKSSGNQKEFLDRFKIHNKALNQVTSLLTSSSSNYSKFLELFLIISIAGLIFYHLLSGHSTENFLLISVLAALSIKIVPSLSKILNSLTMIRSHWYSIDLLQDIYQSESRPKVHTEFKTTLEFRNIDFEYQQQTPIFKNLHFTIERGKVIGIKGLTGSGKTTFLHIAAGLLVPQNGEIILDGEKLEKNHFFPFVSYLAQQPFLFNGTLLENIMMRQNEKPNVKHLDTLLENLELKTLVDELPQGLQTIITHNTPKLSGGQKQRLALLRALYHKPTLLILDEATNQQNEALENRIHQFLRKIVTQENMAILAVSHQSDIDLFCDRVYVLEKNNLTLAGAN
ncbi:ABC transporter ATP-binding protein [Flavobacterium sp. CYK-4]|uniref:ATP-binding cassette domain-containing protein n=1 Tax=Flavobacterium lotistagni TaxID=2709660 RepID=UPI001409C977|nr:ABC transporter ATP-binding protein [Flavobacterium lotistagni]NHM05881.1 ABC transporter ATP-binding protein [Flavobacterium lotistagni]